MTANDALTHDWLKPQSHEVSDKFISDHLIWKVSYLYKTF